MNEFESRLRAQLGRVDAPASLADAVMSRIAAEPRSTLSLPMRTAWMGRLAAMILMAALLFAAGAGIEHRRALERMQAGRNFARSQELTSRALEPVRRHLRRAGVPLEQ